MFCFSNFISVYLHKYHSLFKIYWKNESFKSYDVTPRSMYYKYICQNLWRPLKYWGYALLGPRKCCPVPFVHKFQNNSSIFSFNFDYLSSCSENVLKFLGALFFSRKVLIILQNHRTVKPQQRLLPFSFCFPDKLQDQRDCSSIHVQCNIITLGA